MSSHTWFIEQLEVEKAKFEDDACHLSTYQNGAFQLCYELLREDATALAKRSKQRRSVRLRARTVLVDVFTDLGCEMFLLCAVTTTISTLATIPIKGLVPALRKWWKGVSHLNGLKEIASKVCESNSIGSSISALTLPSTKRRISETGNIVPSTRRSRLSQSCSPGFDEQYHDTISKLRNVSHAQPLQPQLTNRIVGLAQVGSDPSQKVTSTQDALPDAHFRDVIPSRRADQPNESVINFELRELFAFLQQYEDSCPNLQTGCPWDGVLLLLKSLLAFFQQHEISFSNMQIRCPWDGILLPSINFDIKSSSGLGSKVELSHELGARFLEYILVSRETAAEVPH